MNFLKTVIVCIPILLSFTSEANVFKCKIKGEVIFTDVPCEGEDGHELPKYSKKEPEVLIPSRKSIKPTYDSVIDRVFWAMDNRSILCKSFWPGNYSMQKSCEQTQRSSVSDIQDVMENPSNTSQDFAKLDDCLNLWQRGGSIDLTMIVTCFKN